MSVLRSKQADCKTVSEPMEWIIWGGELQSELNISLQAVSTEFCRLYSAGFGRGRALVNTGKRRTRVEIKEKIA